MVNELKAIQAYSSTRATTRTPRALEYEALAISTRRLEAHSKIASEAFPEFAKALHDNRRLWAVFASDVLNAENPLPAETKAGIYSLALFTSQETSRILNRKGDVRNLIDINLSVLRGLQSEAA